MPLDHSFCTFTFSSLDANPSIAIVAESDRKDPSYKKRRVETSSGYAIMLDDPYCDCKTYGELQGAESPVLAKSVTMILHDPHAMIELESASAVRFSWKFRFDKQKFKFRKENPLVKGPSSLAVEWIPPKEFSDDPNILVAQIAFKSKRTTLSILDHNLKRLGIQDIKGFEICLILSLFFFFSLWEMEGSHNLLMPESKRLTQFRDPMEELQDVARSESIAAELRQDQASGRSVMGRLLRRKSTMYTRQIGSPPSKDTAIQA